MTISEKAVEAAARAMCKARRERYGLPDVQSLDDLNSWAQADYRNEVRAALEAAASLPLQDGHEHGSLTDKAAAWDAVAEKNAEIARLAATLDRYRYVYHWWASDSYDQGGEFNARMNWARGEDAAADLTDNRAAEIGQQFLVQSGRAPRPPYIADESQP